MQASETTSATVPYRAEAGYSYPPETVVVTRAEQTRLLGWCGIDAALYGDTADPTFIARRPVLLNTATIRAARPDWGPVHTVHRIRQRRPIALHEELRMHGEVSALTPHPRGLLLHTRWRYFDAAGLEVFTVEPEVLMIDPAGAAPPRAAPLPARAAPEALARHQCTPETTLGYCAGSTNLIHLDPEFARGFGLRAPIIAGMQTINCLVAPLYREAAPTAFELVVRFLRPVFWDDALSIAGARAADGALAYVCAANGADRRVAECEITRA